MTDNPTQPNPLLQEWNTPFSIAPFDQISPEHFKPAVEHAIEVARREIDEIVACNAEPGFGNTIEALETGRRTSEPHHSHPLQSQQLRHLP